jgi:WD40 repeat protein
LKGCSDARGDVYGLGVTLYEMLTLRPAFAGADRARLVEQIAHEQPPRPRTIDPKVPRDLETVVLKAIDKDPAHRYQTATELAADLQRFVEDRPIRARRVTPAERLWRWGRRNPLVASLVAGIALALLLGSAIATYFAFAEAAARRDADEKARAEAEARQERETDLYFHRITLAHRELSADNLDPAQKLLDECPNGLRDWEWYYLKRLCRVEPIVFRDTTAVSGIAFSPDGQQIASAGADGAVKVWDVQTRQVIQKLSAAHKPFAFSVAFRPPDGRYLASAGNDGFVRLSEWKTGQQVFHRGGRRESPFVGMAHSVAFSPDGRHLIAGSDEAVGAIVWDADDGREVRRLPKHEKAAQSVAFSPDGGLMASGSSGGGVRIWDARTGQLRHELRGHEGRRVTAVVFHPDGRWLATAGWDRTVKLWDTTTGELLHTLRGHHGLVSGLAFSPDGRRLASSGIHEKTVKIWDPVTERDILSLRGHTLPCNCVTFSPDGRWLASAGDDRTIRIWDATPLGGNQGRESRTCEHGREVWSVAFSPDGSYLASASWDTTVHLWNARTGAPLRKLDHPPAGADVVFSPDGRRLAASTITSDRIAITKVWDIPTGEEVFTIDGYFKTYDPSGQYLLPGRLSTLSVCNTRTGQEIGVLGQHPDQIWCVTFSPDGRRLASASMNGTVKVWAWDPARLGQVLRDLGTSTVGLMGAPLAPGPLLAASAFVAGSAAQGQEPELTLPPTHLLGFSNRVAFSSDGRRLATVGEEHTIKIWDATKPGPELKTLRGHTGDVYAVAFSPDGRWLASAGQDTTVRLWDVTSWELRHTLRGHTGLVVSLAFSRDSQRLASGSWDYTAKIWDLSLLQGERPR